MSNEDDQQLISNNVFDNAYGERMSNEDIHKIISDDVNDGEQCNQDLNDALTEESDNNDVSSPYQSRTWTPNVGDMFKPIVGTKFGNLKDAFEAYKKYSKAAGFDVRKSTQRTDRKGIVLRKFFVCSKEGMKKRSSYNTLEGTSKKDKRRRPEFRSSCPACIKLHVVHGNCYEVYKFVEEHNHCLVLPEDEHLLRSNRKMSYSQQYFTMKLSNANIGPVSSYNLAKEMVGSYDRVGATKTEFKNFSRDVSSFIGNKDTQMIVDKFTLKKDTMPNFSFEYLVGDKGELSGCFWADETCKLNYKAFGDVVSFDATFKKNKYNMVFVPFTGIDNHQKCVIFGAGLLSDEKKEPYAWLLNAFLSVHGSEPQMVITDQDLGMKAAIEVVFKSAKHRLCMWHIMNKLPSKIGTQLNDDDDVGFRSRFNNLVWSEYIEPTQFEEQWMSLLAEYKLECHQWLRDMFDIRDRWIPAYYRHIQMSGLMKTTSRSESENYFFGQNSNWKSTLVHFFSRFETAIDKQRYTQRLLDHETRTTTPMMETPLLIERHAAEVYTREIFYVVQQEIIASLWTCSTLSKEIIQDRDKERKGEFKVLFDEKDHIITCTCLHFELYGILCRHAFYVLRHHEIKKIPKRYILQRWRKDAVKLPSTKAILNGTPDTNNALSDIYSSIGRVTSCLGNDIEKLGQFLECIKLFENELESNSISESSRSKKDTIESFIGITQPTEITIKVPKNARNKGCGTSKRYVGAREESINKKFKRQKNL